MAPCGKHELTRLGSDYAYGAAESNEPLVGTEGRTDVGLPFAGNHIHEFAGKVNQFVCLALCLTVFRDETEKN